MVCVLRPNHLPRGIPCIIIAVIYDPPNADEKLMQVHLFQNRTLIEPEFPNCEVIVTGDFIRLNVSRLLIIIFASSKS